MQDCGAGIVLISRSDANDPTVPSEGVCFVYVLMPKMAK